MERGQPPCYTEVAGHGTASHAFPVVSILFYLGAVVSGAWYVAPKALHAARTLRPDMNLLMLVAVVGDGVNHAPDMGASLLVICHGLRLLREPPSGS